MAEVQYKASGFWNRSCERSLRWNDPSLAIAWPLQKAGVMEPLLAQKDAEAPALVDLNRLGGVCVKVLLTGAGGQLGQALRKALPAQIDHQQSS